jgi:hypothetical protein
MNGKNNQPIINEPSGSNTDQSIPPVPPSGSTVVSGEQNDMIHQGLPPKKNSNRWLWTGIVFAGVLLVVGVAVMLLARKPNPVPPVVSAPKVVPPLVTTNAPATLGPGTYVVGSDKNIVPGLYSLSPGSQQHGNFTILSSTASHSVILDDNTDGVTNTKEAWAQLSTGDKVQISGGNLSTVNFRAVVTSTSAQSALAKLYDDVFTVTDTPHRTNPGRYFVTDSQDKDAYILIVDKDHNIKYNEPLNGTGFLATLEDGDQIATINMTTYLMKPE